MVDHVRVTITDEEKGQGRISPQNALSARNTLLNNGYLILDNLFSLEEISAIKEEVYEQQAMQKSGNSGLEYEACRSLDKGREMIPLWLKGPILNENIYANIFLLSICKAVLSHRLIIGGAGAVVSYPGTSIQRIHHDGDVLFLDKLSINQDIPPFALTVAIPLVELNKEVGGTSVLLGSHKSTLKGKNTEQYFEEHCFTEYPTLGGCAVWDYRVLHRGEANNSDIVRPYLYLTMSREWYRDPNFFQHNAYNISQECLDSIPKKYSNLFMLSAYKSAKVYK